jgi:hypothetical protein
MIEVGTTAVDRRFPRRSLGNDGSPNDRRVIRLFSRSTRSLRRAAVEPLRSDPIGADELWFSRSGFIVMTKVEKSTVLFSKVRFGRDSVLGRLFDPYDRIGGDRYRIEIKDIIKNR